jgi:ribosomal protein L37E
MAEDWTNQPLFVLCKRCGKQTLNGGDGLCVACRTLARVKAIAGIKEDRHDDTR